MDKKRPPGKPDRSLKHVLWVMAFGRPAEVDALFGGAEPDTLSKQMNAAEQQASGAADKKWQERTSKAVGNEVGRER
jgi:hypothetical protein